MPSPPGTPLATPPPSPGAPHFMFLRRRASSVLPSGVPRLPAERPPGLEVLRPPDPVQRHTPAPRLLIVPQHTLPPLRLAVLPRFATWTWTTDDPGHQPPCPGGRQLSKSGACIPAQRGGHCLCHSVVVFVCTVILCMLPHSYS